MTTAPRTALIEIDLQAWVLALGHRDVRPRAVQARRRARSIDALLVCTRYLDPDPASPHGDPASPDVAFAPGLAPEPGDLVLTKNGKDLTANPDLDANLRLRGITAVLLVGALTDHGVDLAARGLARLGYEVTVVEDACAASSAEAHHATLARWRHAGLRWSALQDIASST